MPVTQSVIITQADVRDVESIAPLFDAYRQFYGQAPDLEQARQYIADRLTRNESVIFLATQYEIPVGFVQLYPSFSSVEMRRLWILNDLFVSPAGRKLGVGQALMVRAREFAAATGAGALMLETATDNLPAQQLYEKLGWVRETHFYTYYLHL